MKGLAMEDRRISSITSRFCIHQFDRTDVRICFLGGSRISLIFYDVFSDLTKTLQRILGSFPCGEQNDCVAGFKGTEEEIFLAFQRATAKMAAKSFHSMRKSCEN